MSEFAIRDDSQLHRWAISAAAVVLVHGAIVAGLLNWPRTEPNGPVMIDLPPMPASVAGEQAQPAVGVPPGLVEKIEQETQREIAPSGVERTEPTRAEEPLSAPAPFSPAPVASETARMEDGTDSRPGSGGGAAGAVAAGTGNPIDTRIGGTRLTERPGSRFSKAAKATDWKQPAYGKRPFVVVRPAMNSGPRQLAHGSPATDSMLGSRGIEGITRNAIGLPMQGPPGARGPMAENQAPQSNAIGAKTSAGVAATTNAVGSTITNAIGMTVVSHPSATGENAAIAAAYHLGVPEANSAVGAAHAGAAAANAASHPGLPPTDPTLGIVHVGSPVSAVPNGSINGTNMVRPGARIGLIGGPAKNVGVLNGTAITPRHP